DGSVDAADYVVWRKGLGTTHTPDDYNVWRAHFGQTTGSGASVPLAPGDSPRADSAVPEPSGVVLIALSFARLLACYRKRDHRPAGGSLPTGYNARRDKNGSVNEW
ncbi:MAG: hypothetical protein WD229_00360, partial [Pirellulales bacterium]